jgi:flagellin
MALSIQNNIASLVAQGNLNKSSSALNTSLQRLSSGLKINTGADGPAALVISNEQGAQIAGLQSAIENTNQAVSLVQTSEGALSEVNDLLVQIRGLALSAANSAVNDPTALAADQAQITNALQTIDNIAANTQFGTKRLLDGSQAAQVTLGTTGASNIAPNGVTATANTVAGTFDIAVTQQGQKAQLIGANAFVAAQNTATTTDGTAISGNATISPTLTQTGTYDVTVTQQGLKGFITGGSGASATGSGGAVGTIVISGGTLAGPVTVNLAGDNTDNTDALVLGKINTALTGSGYTATEDATTKKITITENGFVHEGSALSVAVTGSGAVASGFAGTEVASQVGQTAQVQIAGGNLSSPITVSGTTATGTTINVTAGISSIAQGLNFTLASSGNATSAVGSTGSVTVTGNSSLTLGSGASATTINLNAQNADTLAHLVTAINAYSTTTGVSASQNQGGTNLVLTADAFGGSNFAFAASGTSSGVVTNQAFSLNAQTLQAKVFDASGNQLGGVITATGVNGDTIVANGSSFGDANGLSVQLAAQGTSNNVTGVQTAGVPNAGQYTASITLANALVFQIGANANQTASLSIQNTNASFLGKNVAGLSNASTDSLAKINVTTTAGANDALKVIDQSIADISSLRGSLGAFQTNTLQATAANLQTTLTNTTAAQSVIRDTDFAAETANFTKAQVLVQAGTTVLTNANATAQLILNLLK